MNNKLITIKEGLEWDLNWWNNKLKSLDDNDEVMRGYCKGRIIGIEDILFTINFYLDKEDTSDE